MLLFSSFKHRIALILLFLSCASFASCLSAALNSVRQNDNPSIKMVIARNLIGQSRYRAARKALDLIRSEYPDNPALLIEIDYEDAYIDLRKKRYTIAKEKFQKIISQYDNGKNPALPKWPYYLSKKLVEDNIQAALDKGKK